MMETRYADGRVEKNIVQLDQASARMQELLADPAVQEVRTRKIEVGEEVELHGRMFRLTDAGWRRVNGQDPRKTGELTPVERKLLGVAK